MGQQNKWLLIHIINYWNRQKKATTLHGVNVYKKKFGVMADLQLMQQMYNSHIMCSNEVLELEGGKYAGWKNDHIIVEE